MWTYIDGGADVDVDSISSGWEDDGDKDEDVQTKVNYKREQHRAHIERNRMEHGVQNRQRDEGPQARGATTERRRGRTGRDGLRTRKRPYEETWDGRQ